MKDSANDGSRVADVEGAHERRSPKGQGLLRKEGPLTHYFVAKLSIVGIYTLL